MTAIRNELSSVLPIEPEAVQPARASPVRVPLTSTVEAHAKGAAGDVPATGSMAGALPSSVVQQLDSSSAVREIRQLVATGLTDWRVSEGECRSAIGILNSLPKGEYLKAVKELERTRDLPTLCDALSPELRGLLVQSALNCGATSETTPKSAPGRRTPCPPDQPALINNEPSLPSSMRELIHGENVHRGARYQSALNRYVDAYCERVKQCTSPLELRSVGPVSTPPPLQEPGLGELDFAAQRYVKNLSASNVGIERASRAVSDQISAFRKELRAGGFGLDAEFKLQATRHQAVGKAGVEGGVATVFKGTVTDDGRLLKKSEVQGIVGAELHENKVEMKFVHGKLEAVGADVHGNGLEIERDGKVVFKAGVGHEASVQTFTNPREGTMGAQVEFEKEVSLPFGFDRKVSLKLGVTAQGSNVEYLEDVTAQREGFFGPMEELTQGQKWTDLKTDRREWYERQGFTSANWPSR